MGVGIGLGFGLDRNATPNKGGGGGGGSFDFDPLTARYTYSGDSIPTLDDDTGFIYWGSALTGGPLPLPPYSRQSVSGSEIGEGVVATNTKDMLYPTRKQLLEDAIMTGDVVGVAIGTNSISDQSAAATIAGLTQLYAGLLAKGAFLEIYTILPSASNAGADLNTVNQWIRDRETDGLSYLGTDYPASRFLVVDGYTAWGGTYVGHTDSGNLHPNTNGAIKIGRAKRAAYIAKGRAYSPLIYGTSNPAANILANWNLAAGTAGTLTGTGNTLINNGVPTGTAVTVTASAGLTVQTDIVLNWVPTLFGLTPFPVLKVTVTGTALLQADVTISMQNNITTVPPGSSFEASCYARWKGVGATADPTGLFAFGLNYTPAKWASNNSSTLTNFTNVTLGDEGVLRGRQTPPVQAFGNSSMQVPLRVRSGDAASFEFIFGQPYVAAAERTAYAIPKSLHTDQDSIGGVLTGPQVGSSPTAWTATAGTPVTGRPGLAWRGGDPTFQFTWQRDRGGVVTDVAGPTTVTTTVGTTQFTPSGNSGDKFRLKVTMTNSLGSGEAFSVWSSALA